jgi:hypothetical protein
LYLVVGFLEARAKWAENKRTNNNNKQDNEKNPNPTTTYKKVSPSIHFLF